MERYIFLRLYIGGVDSRAFLGSFRYSGGFFLTVFGWVWVPGGRRSGMQHRFITSL
jgi:hypothetical protein